jgi:hypothetical protein
MLIDCKSMFLICYFTDNLIFNDPTGSPFFCTKSHEKHDEFQLLNMQIKQPKCSSVWINTQPTSKFKACLMMPALQITY